MLPAKRNQSGGPLHRQKAEAQKLGNHAMLAGAGTVAGTGLLWLVGVPFLPTLAFIGGAGYTGYRAYEWIKYRAKWGLRF